MVANWNARTPLKLSRKRTKSLAKLKNAAAVMWTLLSEAPPPVRYALGLTLLVLVTALAGCATTSAPPSFTPRNPAPPPTRLSESPPDYLSNAQRFISESRKTLQELISRPAN